MHSEIAPSTSAAGRYSGSCLCHRDEGRRESARSLLSHACCARVCAMAPRQLTADNANFAHTARQQQHHQIQCAPRRAAKLNPIGSETGAHVAASKHIATPIMRRWRTKRVSGVAAAATRRPLEHLVCHHLCLRRPRLAVSQGARCVCVCLGSSAPAHQFFGRRVTADPLERAERGAKLRTFGATPDSQRRPQSAGSGESARAAAATRRAPRALPQVERTGRPQGYLAALWPLPLVRVSASCMQLLAANLICME